MKGKYFRKHVRLGSHGMKGEDAQRDGVGGKERIDFPVGEAVQ